MATALPPDQFLAAMESRFSGRLHSDYPMVRNIHAGTATRDQIAYLGVLFYHFTKYTPQVLSTIHSRCGDRRLRRAIMDNLIDEDTDLRCGSAGHDELAMEFATRFTGMTVDEVEAHAVPDCLSAMTAYRFQVARDMPTVIALGNSGVASESHAPEMCRLISDGLRAHYGVADEDQESWIVHIEGDEDHSSTAFAKVLEYATTADLQDKMYWCIDSYLGHWGNFWRECERGAIELPARLASA